MFGYGYDSLHTPDILVCPPMIILSHYKFVFTLFEGTKIGMRFPRRKSYGYVSELLIASLVLCNVEV